MKDSIIVFKNEETLLNENAIELIKTDIGYNNEELKATSLDDLLILKRAIYYYLKSPNLKKRNPNYLKLYKRIIEELRERNPLGQKQNSKSEKVINKFYQNFILKLAWKK